MKRRSLLAALPAAAAAPAIAAPQTPSPKWLPIETAPKTSAEKIHTILIGDGICVPDIVSWRPAQPERIVRGTRYLAQPPGWFCLNGGRSRITNPTVWAPIPEYEA